MSEVAIVGGVLGGSGNDHDERFGGHGVALMVNCDEGDREAISDEIMRCTVICVALIVAHCLEYSVSYRDCRRRSSWHNCW